MSLSRRERWIACACLVIVGLWVLDSAVLTPLWNARQADAERAEVLEREVAQAESLLAREQVLGRRWRSRLAAGIDRPAADAESDLFNALGRWAGEAGLNVRSMKPDRQDADDGLQVVGCRLTADGAMSAFRRFCWLVETASAPLRVETLQLSSTDATTDSLMIQMQVSAVCLAGNEEARVSR